MMLGWGFSNTKGPAMNDMIFNRTLLPIKVIATQGSVLPMFLLAVGYLSRKISNLYSYAGHYLTKFRV